MAWVRLDKSPWRGYLQPSSDPEHGLVFDYANGRMTYSRPIGYTGRSDYNFGVEGFPPLDARPLRVRIVVEEYESAIPLQNPAQFDRIGTSTQGLVVVAENLAPPGIGFEPSIVEFPENVNPIYQGSRVSNTEFGDLRYVHRIEVWVNDGSGGGGDSGGGGGGQASSSAPVAPIPHVNEPFIDAAGRVTRSWRTYLSSRTQGDAAAELQAQVAANTAAIAALQSADGGSAGAVIGLDSVHAFGTLADGTVYVKLRDDALDPGTTRYYGTGPDGTKGWHAIAAAMDAATGELVNAVDPDTGVTTLGLAELPDTGGGELRKIDRDEFGRVAGTSSAEAPQDGKQYARQDGDWSEVQSSGGGVLPMVNGETPPVLMYGGNQLIYARVE